MTGSCSNSSLASQRPAIAAARKGILLRRLVKYGRVACQKLQLCTQPFDHLVAGLVDPSRWFADLRCRLTRFYVTQPRQVKCLPDFRVKLRPNSFERELKHIAIKFLGPMRIIGG